MYLYMIWITTNEIVECCVQAQEPALLHKKTPTASGYIRLKAHSHRVKAKAKKIKEPEKEIKEKISNIKENFSFRFCFRSM